MKLVVMMFSAAIILHVVSITCGRAAVAKAVAPKASFTPKFVGDTLRDKIRGAGCNASNYIYQVAFLYLHDPGQKINYGNDNVKKAFQTKQLGTKLKPRKSARPPYWPLDPLRTNILIAIPDQKPPTAIEKNNYGHSEHKLLQQLGNLLEGFIQRTTTGKNFECPEYILLGTYYRPCYNCAKDYVQAKRTYNTQNKGRCTNNPTFYLYIFGTYNERGKYFAKFWGDIEKLLTNGGITLLPYPAYNPLSQIAQIQ